MLKGLHNPPATRRRFSLRAEMQRPRLSRFMADEYTPWRHCIRMRSGLRMLVAAGLLATVRSSMAGMVYDEAAGVIRVTDFPRAYPCTPARLFAADQALGWNRVSYDAATDTYTITADLCIGAYDGTETYFQIGSSCAPRETLRLRGNLYISPYWVEGQHPSPHPRNAPLRINRLTLGHAADPDIAATLMFDNPRPGHYSLFMARSPQAGGAIREGYGGQLFVHNGNITAAQPSREHAFGDGDNIHGMRLGGDRVVLSGARLSWCAGIMGSGLDANATIEHTVFEHARGGLINARQLEIVGSTFRNLDLAIRDHGGLDVILRDCRFENNDVHWDLQYSRHGIVAIDCEWDEPHKRNIYARHLHGGTGREHVPTFLSRRHIVVEVVDAEGRPLPDAWVTVQSEDEEWSAVSHGEQITGADGRTPGRGAPRAILLHEFAERADTDGQTLRTTYRYTIQAGAEGFRTKRIQQYTPGRSWAIVRITLHAPRTNILEVKA